MMARLITMSWTISVHFHRLDPLIFIPSQVSTVPIHVCMPCSCILPNSSVASSFLHLSLTWNKSKSLGSLPIVLLPLIILGRAIIVSLSPLMDMLLSPNSTAEPGGLSPFFCVCNWWAAKYNLSTSYLFCDTELILKWNSCLKEQSYFRTHIIRQFLIWPGDIEKNLEALS